MFSRFARMRSARERDFSMDLVCTNCGEPWSLDYVLHDAPDDFSRSGAAIIGCPCCKDRKCELTKEERERLSAARELGELLGDDVDGYACQLEDMGLT
jgi:hypothetical protein